MGWMMSKVELRAIMRERLRTALLTRDENSAGICDAIRRETAWLQASTVAIFASQPQEPDVERLWHFAAHRTLCYPRVRDSELDFLRVDSPAELMPARWGLREPRFLPERMVAISEIDVLLVPGIAFTRRGDRLGRGGGFYDRMLARPDLRAATIGVCFELQILKELPIESHDERVGMVITEGTHAAKQSTPEAPVGDKLDG